MVREVGLLIRRSLPLLLLVVLSGCSSLGASSQDKEVTQAQKVRAEREALISQLKTHYEQAEKHYANGELDAAEGEYQAMLALRSEEENALYRLGNIAFRKGEYEKSAGFFERVIAVNPRNGKAHYNLASIRLMQAERHFKYFAATADGKADLQKVSTLLGHIDEFAADATKKDNAAFLDRISGAIKK